MTGHADPSTAGRDQLLQLIDAARAARPAWWFDEEHHDLAADARDEAGRGRDEAAASRDVTASQRDEDATEREQAATDLTKNAHERLDAHTAQSVDAMVGYERSLIELQRMFDEVRSAPGIPGPVIDQLQRRVELILDRSYVATLGVTYERDDSRKDLRSIAQHLDAALRDRLAAGQDRTDTAADRQAADRDRQHARNDRHRAALHRATDNA